MLRFLLRFFLLLLAAPTLLYAQLSTKPLIEDVGIDEHLGEFLDLDLEFFDESGKKVTLGDYVRGDKPVIFAPVYYSCPSICTVVLNGLVDLINEMDLQLGMDYRVVNISFDPENTPELAREKAANYYELLDVPERAKSQWHFLTGTPESIKSFTDSIGFKYKKVNDQYSHGSVIVYSSPKGKITRYIYGTNYNPKDARLATVEAGGGKVGATIDKILVYCFRYDPLSGKYVPYAWRLMRIGSFFGLVGLVAFMWMFWKRELFHGRRLGQNVP